MKKVTKKLMARLKCICGEILSNSSCPKIEYKVFSDDEWNTLIDKTENGEKPLDFGGYVVHLWKCSNCMRVYFFTRGNDTPHIYKIEKDAKFEW